MMLPVLILCGGRGTRIRGVTDDTPKPMVDVGGRPLVWHIMKGYAMYGVTDFVLLLGYRGEVIRDYFLNYRTRVADVAVLLDGGVEVLQSHEEKWRVVLIDTGQEAMTGARIFRGAKYGGGTFFATYGDGVANVDVGRLLDFHRCHGKLATVTGVRPPGRFGELSILGNQVIGFDEKPQVTQGLINGGFFVFEREFVDRYLHSDDCLMLEREPLMQAARDGELCAYRHDGFWLPVDTFKEWSLLNELWQTGKAPWKTWS